MKRTIIVLLIGIFAGNLQAQSDLKKLLKKNKLPDHLHILAVKNEDCLNCYYGFSFFLKKHDSLLYGPDFYFLFEERSRPETDAIFQYRLALDRKKCRVIYNDELFNSLILRDASTLNLIDHGKIKAQYNSNTLYQFEQEQQPQLLSPRLKDSIRLDARYGTSKLEVQFLDGDRAAIWNRFSNSIDIFDLTNKKTLHQLSFSYFTEHYDSLLRIVLQQDPTNLTYNLEHYHQADVYKSFPVLKIKHIKCKQGFVFVGISISHMVPEENGHISYEGIQCILKFNDQLQLLEVVPLPEKLENAPGRYLSLLDFDFLNSDTVALNLSAEGDRKKDSVLVLYSLGRNQALLFPKMAFESFMPLKGSNGYYNFYHWGVFSEKDSLFGYFTRSPYLYQLQTNRKSLIPGLPVEANAMDLEGKDKSFWICTMGVYQTHGYAVLIGRDAHTWLYEYNAEFTSLLKKTTLLDGYLDKIVVFNGNLLGVQTYTEKADVCVVYRYGLN